MLIILDPADTSPLYGQIVRQVVEQIAAGTIKPGEKLPTAVELAETLDLNRNTVLQAYRQLRDDGFLELRRGRGAIARNPHTTTHPSTLESLAEQLVHTARHAGTSLAEVTALLRQKGLS